MSAADPVITGNNYIAGNWQPGQDSAFQSTDPYNGAAIWEGCMSSAADAEAAIEAARAAFPAWAGLSLQRREELLRNYANKLDENKPALAELISRDMGKPLWESLGEVGAMIGKVEISIKALHDRCGTREAPLGDARSVTRFKPHGVVGVFGAYNFPGHLPNGHIVPALLAGNTVVFKPSTQTPAVGQRMVELLEESGLPPGTINLLHANRVGGKVLAEHPDVDGVFFTGSSSVGKAIHRAHGGHPEKVLALEMGGNNPLIVHDFDDLDAAVYWTIQSAFITSGQRCVCARRLIVTQGASNDEYIDRLVSKLPEIRCGHYRDDPEPFMGPLISAAAAEDVLRAQSQLIERGAKPLVTSQRIDKSPAVLTPGFVDSTSASNIPDDEIFGPVLQLLRVKDLDAAIVEANRTIYGLAAAIFCRSPADHQRFFELSRAGIVNWNKPTTGASSAAPFGGIGQSGNHNPSAYFAADYCAYPVASIETETLKMPESLTPGLD